jgi:hypothetical protein
MGVEPLLKIGLRPSLVEPVSRICSCLTSFLSNRLVIRANFLKEGVSLAWLWYWNIMSVGERFELGVGPAVYGLAKKDK